MPSLKSVFFAQVFRFKYTKFVLFLNRNDQQTIFLDIWNIIKFRVWPLFYYYDLRMHEWLYAGKLLIIFSSKSFCWGTSFNLIWMKDENMWKHNLNFYEAMNTYF